MSRKFNSVVDVRSHVLSCLTSNKFLAGRGLASQLPIFIAAYDPLETVESRKLPEWLQEQSLLAGVKVLAINVFSELVQSLSDQRILDSVVENERAKAISNKQVISIIHSAADLGIRLPGKIQSLIDSEMPQALLISGLDAAFPFVRVTEIVSTLEEMQLVAPVVILFPGSFDNTLKSPVLKLFGEVEENHNYRALDLFNYEA